MSDFTRGFGFGAGISLATGRQVQPILLKRLVTNVLYLLFTIWGVFLAFSFQQAAPAQHLFAEFVERTPSLGSYYPWMFTTYAYGFAGIALGLIYVLSGCLIFLGAEPLVDLRDLGKFGDFLAWLAFAVPMYALTYDVAYYWFGNSCAFWVFGCLSFTNAAFFFAKIAACVYLFREFTVLLSRERATKSFNGDDVKNVTGGGVFFTPGAPLPHIIYAPAQALLGVVPLLWHLYVGPDGRYSSHEITHRYE
jgi:hypothetical protein